jgi:hypothetical protein
VVEEGKVEREREREVEKEKQNKTTRTFVRNMTKGVFLVDTKADDKKIGVGIRQRTKLIVIRLTYMGRRRKKVKKKKEGEKWMQRK